MRFLTIYSLYMTIWIFLSSVIRDKERILKSVYFIIFPSLFAAFGTFYFTNIKNNQMIPKSQWKFLGFNNYDNIQIEYSIMIVL
jgi:hypothetical protein